MSILVCAIGARSAVEIGTFTGYSAICIARGLPADGRLLCCDISEEWPKIARKYWAKAGVADRIELKIGPAAETLKALPANHQIAAKYPHPSTMAATKRGLTTRKESMSDWK